MEAEAWTDFYLVAGASAAVLLGLLFIALSINREIIAGHPTLGGQGLQAIAGLSSVFVVSLLVLIPDQSEDALGAELLAGGLILCFGIAIPRQIPRARAVSGVARRDYILRSAVFDGSALLYAATGASLIAGWEDALYLLAPAVGIMTLLAIVNSWKLTLVGAK